MKRAVVTGNFDGVHKGHLELLTQLKELAQSRQLVATLLSFEPHTRHFLYPDEPLNLLTLNREKTNLLQNFEIEHHIIPFNAVTKNLTPQDFIHDILIEKFETALWLMGFDHRFGAGASGESSHAENNGIEIIQAQAIHHVDAPISSSRIRQAIENANFAEAEAMLGYAYTVSGIVQTGDALGRTLGFPTANLSIPKIKCMPPQGVYAGWAIYQGQKYPAVAHYGARPTLDPNEIRFEVHLLDFNTDLYGQDLSFEFVDFIRPIQKFKGLEELKQAITEDCAKSKIVLSPCASLKKIYI